MCICSLFELKSSVDEAFHPVVIVQLPAAVGHMQNYETHSGGLERIVKPLFIRHGVSSLLGACPAATRDGLIARVNTMLDADRKSVV